MYFSALKSNRDGLDLSLVEAVKPGTVIDLNGSLVMCHDVTQGLPTAFQRCDVIYSDLSWRRGMKLFNELAGASTDFHTYMSSVTEAVLELNKPAFIVAGAEVQNYMKEARYFFETKLNGDKARCYVFNFSETISASNTVSLLELLAHRFNCVGDFCCGFGRAGDIFRKYGKKFVMSDINGKCIQIIISHYQATQ